MNPPANPKKLLRFHSLFLFSFFSLVLSVFLLNFSPTQHVFAQGAGGGSGGGTSNPYVYQLNVSVWDSTNKHGAAATVSWSKTGASGGGYTSSGYKSFGALGAGYYSVSATSAGCGTAYSGTQVGATNPSPTIYLYLYCPSEAPVITPKPITPPPPAPKPKKVSGTIFDQSKSGYKGNGSVSIYNKTLGGTPTVVDVINSQYSFGEFRAGKYTYTFTFNPPSGFYSVPPTTLERGMLDGDSVVANFTVGKSAPSCYSFSGRIFDDTSDRNGEKANNNTTEPWLSGVGITMSGYDAIATGPDGKFSFACVSKGDHTVKLSRSNYNPGSFDITISDHAVSGFVYPLTKPAGSTGGVTPPKEIKLIVKTQADTGIGAPIAGAFISICGDAGSGTGKGTCPHGTTANDGTITKTVGANTTYTVTANGTYLAGSKKITTGTSDMTVIVVLYQTNLKYSISGKVTGILDKKPVPGFTMTIYKVSGSSSVERGVAVTLNDGTYSFPAKSFEPGDYKLKFEKTGYNGTTTIIHTITNKDLALDFHVAKSGGGTISTSPDPKNCFVVSGRVYQDTNKKGDKGNNTDEPWLSGATVQIFKKGTTGGTGTTTATGSDGKFSFSCITNGDYLLSAKIGYKQPDGTTISPDYTASITVANHDISSLTMPIVPPAGGGTATSPAPSIKNTISGTIWLKNSDGSMKTLTGVTGVKVTATNTSNQTKTTTLNSGNGTYSLTELNNPTYTVSVGAISNMQFVSASSQAVNFSSSVHSIKIDFIVSNISTSPSVVPGNGGSGGSTGGTGNTGGNNTPTPTQKPIPTPTKIPLTKRITGQIWLKVGSSKQKYTKGGLNITATNTSNQHKTVKINSDGTYQIPSLNASSYTVAMTAPKDTVLSTANNVAVSFAKTDNATVDFTLTSTLTPTPSPILTPGPVCLQVITYARNTSSNTCETFSNSCLPDGWVKDDTCNPSNITPSPSLSPSPSVDVTAVPSITVIPSQEITPSPSLIPTDTPVPNGTKLQVAVFLHGLGNSGDNAADSSTTSTKNPVHPQRAVTITITDPQKVTTTRTGFIMYNSAKGDFEGTIDLGTIEKAEGYSVKISTPQFLSKTFDQIVSLNPGQTVTLDPITLVNGDVDHNNVLNILDYNIILGCWSDLEPAVDCQTGQNVDADINDDGAVNQFDYSLFKRELVNQHGD